MSTENLVSNYEISVWRDILNSNGTSFDEERVGVIGADTMISQSRVLEPRLVRKVNGEKKLTFKMYKQYIDNITGEKVENIFCSWLANETKVKLHYENKWYDFIIKNIQENSSTYLNTYSLEESLVQELSKNGFGVTLNAKLMNNLGTVEKLATEVLKETDWFVECEKFVERIEDNLVYVLLPKEETRIVKLNDQTDFSLGISETEITIPSVTKETDRKIALAFYSSCKNKPNRFQFILLDNYDKNNVEIDENQIIQNKNCQYYYKVFKPHEEYIEISQSSTVGTVYLPEGWDLLIKESEETVGNIVDTTVSNWYRGDRYGFAQQTEYVPLLNKYCNLYQKGETEYYGYVESEYIAPTFVQNIITNAEFKGTTGWTSSYYGTTGNVKSVFGPQIKSVFGRFITAEDQSQKFVTIEEDYKNGLGSEADNFNYSSYLQVTFPKKDNNNKGVLINSGFYDNREVIKIINNGDRWVFKAVIFDENANDVTNNFIITLDKMEYDPASGKYNQIGESWGKVENDILTIKNVPDGFTSGIFENTELKFVITPKNSGYEKTYYIQKMECYKEVFDEDENLITPDNLDTEGIINNNIILILKEEAKNKTDIKDLSKTVIKDSKIDYDEYVPIYNTGAEKIQAIDAKESNYFNILQSIAEKFECWLEIQPEYDLAGHATRDANGKIIKKIIRFKNYAGNENNAAFRYGVNLKDIKRTFESKKIVSKLIVKNNNNELAESGFCSIAKAKNNPIGENYIYDFRYYHDQKLMSSEDYVANMYYATNPYTKTTQDGWDISGIEQTTCNTQNYINRISKLNNELKPINEKISGLTLELTKLEADKVVQENTKTAASENIQTTEDKFIALTGVHPENTSAEAYKTISIKEIADTKDDNESLWGNAENNEGWLNPKISYSQLGSNENSPDFQFSVRYDTNAIEFFDDQETVNGAYNEKYEVPISFMVQKYYSTYNDETDETAVECIIDGQRLSKTDEKKFDTANFNSNNLNLKVTKTGDRLQTHGGLSIRPQNGFKLNHRYRLTYIMILNNNITLKNIGSHLRSFKNTEIWIQNKFASSTDIAAPKGRVAHAVTIFGTYVGDPNDTKNNWDRFFIQPDRGENGTNIDCRIGNLQLYEFKEPTMSCERDFKIKPTFECITDGGAVSEITPEIICKIPAYSLKGTINYSLVIFDENNGTISKTLSEYFEYKNAFYLANKALNGTTGNNGLIAAINAKQTELNNKQIIRQQLIDKKRLLNQAFYKQYSRFIQEGTWQSEDYIDDNKYYTDAQSVIYTSCYPQVAYTIDVIALNKLPGYELFTFELGDRTYAEDPDFFGSKQRVAVTISEIEEALDDPSQNKIKVQNFKNQFQDLFQKITATVQQTEYSTGAYEKAAALAESDDKIKGAFVSEGLSAYGNKLSVAGQTTVVQDNSGITLTDSATKDQMRLIGGAILMSVEDPDSGQRTWKTGLTPEGISASMVTTGTLNAGNITIMNADEPVFRWDAFGISSFFTQGQNGVISDVNPYKFVRFDKYGLYGISDENGTGSIIDGRTWKPGSSQDIDNIATFALTWDGLKVTGQNGTVARIGRTSDSIINITKNVSSGEGENETITETPVFTVSTDGEVYIRGSLAIGDGTSVDEYANSKAQEALINAKDYTDQQTAGLLDVSDNYSWKFDTRDGILMWNGTQTSGKKVLEINSDGLRLGMRGDSAFEVGPGYIRSHYINIDKPSKTSVIAFQHKVDDTWTNALAIGPVNNDELDKLDEEPSSDTIHASYMNCPFRVTFDGELYSTAGNIGGWNINQNGLGKSLVEEKIVISDEENVYAFVFDEYDIVLKLPSMEDSEDGDAFFSRVEQDIINAFNSKWKGVVQIRKNIYKATKYFQIRKELADYGSIDNDYSNIYGYLKDVDFWQYLYPNNTDFWNHEPMNIFDAEFGSASEGFTSAVSTLSGLTNQNCAFLTIPYSSLVIDEAGVFEKNSTTKLGLCYLGKELFYGEGKTWNQKGRFYTENSKVKDKLTNLYVKDENGYINSGENIIESGKAYSLSISSEVKLNGQLEFIEKDSGEKTCFGPQRMFSTLYVSNLESKECYNNIYNQYNNYFSLSKNSLKLRHPGGKHEYKVNNHTRYSILDPTELTISANFGSATINVNNKIFIGDFTNGYYLEIDPKYGISIGRQKVAIESWT